ncbi:DUF1840 family protein [Arsukibacterium sp.]|uniref:DUF1840 family protein n=1 Tax=Arsukibacterium sp. TaxID=1977258 RepID=UPI002FD9B599
MISFKSSASGTISYHKAVALQLLEMLGRDSKVPSAMYAEDVPKALARLEQQLKLQQQAEQQAIEAQADTSDDATNDTAQAEPPISLSVRAQPLLTLLQQTVAARAGISWE